MPQFRLFGAKFEKSRYAGRQIMEILLNSTQRCFGGPSGGKSDAADSFLIVPRASFELFARGASAGIAKRNQFVDGREGSLGAHRPACANKKNNENKMENHNNDKNNNNGDGADGNNNNNDGDTNSKGGDKPTAAKTSTTTTTTTATTTQQ